MRRFVLYDFYTSCTLIYLIFLNYYTHYFLFYCVMLFAVVKIQMTVTRKWSLPPLVEIYAAIFKRFHYNYYN
jgi:hypothetical protein